MKLNALPTIRPNISCRNQAAKTFLGYYPEIEQFLENSWPALTSHFGDDIAVVLELLTYPEPGGHSELVGWIQSHDDVYEGLDKLERFKDEWFLDHIDEIEDRFNFNIETV
jgi:hypothetical protein